MVPALQKTPLPVNKPKVIYLHRGYRALFVFLQSLATLIKAPFSSSIVFFNRISHSRILPFIYTLCWAVPDSKASRGANLVFCFFLIPVLSYHLWAFPYSGKILRVGSKDSKGKYNLYIII